MPKLKIHYYRDERPDLLKALESGLNNECRLSLSKEIPEDTDLLILAYPTAEKLADLPQLKYLIIPFVGIPETTAELMKKYPHIKVFNIHHNYRAVAENVMAFLLAGIKAIIPADREFRLHDWTIRYGTNPATLLYQKNILICGYGHIGKFLEKFLLPYQVKIDKIKKQSPQPEKGIYPLTTLNSIVGKYDIVINLLPTTLLTKNAFDKLTFANMKETCYFINVGRASTVVEEDLFNALKNKEISGAALDVWYHYPTRKEARKNTPPANYPFHTLDNVILSPHRAGGLNMEENEEFRIQELIKLIKSIADNPGLSGIDLDVGY